MNGTNFVVKQFVFEVQTKMDYLQKCPPSHTPFSFMLNITLTLVRGSFLPQMRRFKIKELKYPELICTTAKI